MESLSAECTHLKQRYDSCFNAWFQGYLQPALGASAPSTPPVAQHVQHGQGAASPSPREQIPLIGSQSRRVVTSWADAFAPRSRNNQGDIAGSPLPSASLGGTSTASVFDDSRPDTIDSMHGLDANGKTRAQLQAHEYDKRCGKVWADYKTCLTKAIGENTSLLALLNQARDEHPLINLSGLEGTAWDSNSVMEE